VHSRNGRGVTFSRKNEKSRGENINTVPESKFTLSRQLKNTAGHVEKRSSREKVRAHRKEKGYNGPGQNRGGRKKRNCSTDAREGLLGGGKRVLEDSLSNCWRTDRDLIT